MALAAVAILAIAFIVMTKKEAPQLQPQPQWPPVNLPPGNFPLPPSVTAKPPDPPGANVIQDAGRVIQDAGKVVALGGVVIGGLEQAGIIGGATEAATEVAITTGAEVATEAATEVAVTTGAEAAAEGVGAGAVAAEGAGTAGGGAVAGAGVAAAAGAGVIVGTLAIFGVSIFTGITRNYQADLWTANQHANYDFLPNHITLQNPYTGDMETFGGYTGPPPIEIIDAATGTRGAHY